MAELPQFLSREENVDATETYELASRRVFFSFIAVLCVAALANVFGQRPVVTSAFAAAAELEVDAPTALRGGIYFQGGFTVRAHEEIRKATLVLDPEPLVVVENGRVIERNLEDVQWAVIESGGRISFVEKSA